MHKINLFICLGTHILSTTGCCMINAVYSNTTVNNLQFVHLYSAIEPEGYSRYAVDTAFFGKILQACRLRRRHPPVTFTSVVIL